MTDDARDQWFMPIEWPGRGEKEVLARKQAPAPASMPDRVEAPQTLLYGPRGEPLLVRRPVPFGFRPERTR